MLVIEMVQALMVNRAVPGQTTLGLMGTAEWVESHVAYSTGASVTIGYADTSMCVLCLDVARPMKR